jgi:hypothetical protein
LAFNNALPSILARWQAAADAAATAVTTAAGHPQGPVPLFEIHSNAAAVAAADAAAVAAAAADTKRDGAEARRMITRFRGGDDSSSSCRGHGGVAGASADSGNSGYNAIFSPEDDQLAIFLTDGDDKVLSMMADIGAELAGIDNGVARYTVPLDAIAPKRRERLLRGGGD